MNKVLIQEQLKNMLGLALNLEKILDEETDIENASTARILKAIKHRMQDIKDRLYEIDTELANLRPKAEEIIL